MKKILITGAGSGLGRALALRYAKAGGEICVCDVNKEGGDETVQLINNLGGSAFFLDCDITKQWDVDKLSIALAERWGALDMLINNAGVATAGQLEYESMEQWQWVLEINLLGHVRMTKAMLPLLRKSQSAQKDIVNIASQAGITAAPGMGSYCVSKAAMVSLSETSHLELAPEGIHVSAVCPAFFDTNLNKSLRTGDEKMKSVVDKMIKKSGISADSIADKVYAGVNARKFMILTHKQGIKAYRMKRFLPIERYLAMIKKRTAKFVKPTT
ncbi:SDR family oxidoreductase [Arenicella sp. 4NH20-0111]|uniref:SDR family oxidoreductase n=1 Tax=Arenicella sp. 4NH20-0111 TaxID=3127648 RepID=UPI003106DFD3